MKILLGREEIEKINQLCVMKNRLEEYFLDYPNRDLINSICAKIRDYAIHSGDQEKLEAFVFEYFKLEKIIVDSRNELIDRVQSKEFKEEKFLNRIRIKKELKKAQKLTDKINMFEKEFFERTNISLLRVENERWAKQKQAEANEKSQTQQIEQ